MTSTSAGGHEPLPLAVVDAGAEHAGPVHEVVVAAFAARPPVDPPTSAVAETVASVRAALQRHGGLLALVSRPGREPEPAGALLFEPSDDGAGLGLRRVSVLPQYRGHGVASALVRAAEVAAARRGARRLTLSARAELPDTVAFWRHRGYAVTGAAAPFLLMSKAAPLDAVLATAADTVAFGEALAGLLRAGDLVLLAGELGAGKTTLTRGIGRGLQVRGEVTSPTFVISRVHPSTVGGPPLVHVDAYRLGDRLEVDDLDLDATLDDAVTVVEWGEGKAEGLADDRLEVTLGRRIGGDDGAPDGGPDDDVRTVRVSGVGSRWVGADLRRLVTGRA